VTVLAVTVDGRTAAPTSAAVVAAVVVEDVDALAAVSGSRVLRTARRTGGAGTDPSNRQQSTHRIQAPRMTSSSSWLQVRAAEENT